MIKRLSIRNYALIEALEIDFSNKLTIITGETGAGKSILLGALGLIMGNRADTKSLYQPNEKCVVEGFFDISKYDVTTFLEANDIDIEHELVVRRELTPAGKSRAFINDTPVTLQVLQQLSSSLIDLHLQFDTLDIHHISFQLRMIDALAGNKSQLIDYQILFKKYQSDKKRLAELIHKNDNANREIEFLNFQLEEFNKAELTEGEQEKIETEQNRLNNAEIIKRSAGGAFRHLTDAENAIAGQVSEVSQLLHGIKKYHPEVANLYTRLEGVKAEIEDISAELETIADETDYEPARIAELQVRLDLIYKLQHKHRVASVTELLNIQQNLQQKLNAFSDLSQQIIDLETKLNAQETQLRTLANVLTDKRKQVIGGFEEKVAKMLQQLAMEHARLKVEVRPLQALTAVGLDEVEFLFAANKGGKLMSIKDVASGGELSRLTLCTKSLVADAIPLPTLIFDEIDSGISGDVAGRMGSILQELAERHQVISITHSPQIASKAHTHYFVYKQVKEDKTATHIRSLTLDERIRAIATMLSTNPPSKNAIENAKELIGNM
jgi:DNA repair protein RecN (Recombination protein N)